jgi:hypothetical protein
LIPERRDDLLPPNPIASGSGVRRTTMTSPDQTAVPTSDLGLQSTIPAETSRSIPDALDLSPGVRLVLEKDALSLPGMHAFFFYSSLSTTRPPRAGRAGPLLICCCPGQGVDKPHRTCGLGSPCKTATGPMPIRTAPPCRLGGGSPPHDLKLTFFSTSI